MVGCLVQVRVQWCMDGGGDINSYLLIHPFIFRKGRVAGLQVGGYFKF